MDPVKHCRKRELVALLSFGLWGVYSVFVQCLFYLSFGFIGRLCSVMVLLPGHLLLFVLHRKSNTAYIVKVMQNEKCLFRPRQNLTLIFFIITFSFAQFKKQHLCSQ